MHLSHSTLLSPCTPPTSIHNTHRLDHVSVLVSRYLVKSMLLLAHSNSLTYTRICCMHGSYSLTIHLIISLILHSQFISFSVGWKMRFTNIVIFSIQNMLFLFKFYITWSVL
ncbi:hypothetical protein EV127DRAFT_213823 [Xylaria flabelliformis]|nr:hypothetical protein EV127DRAFT_213823 [Xylaria flabelliformis]